MSARFLPDDASRLRHAAPGTGAPRGDRERLLDVYVVEDNDVVLENLIGALEELAPVRVVGSAPEEGAAVQWLKADGTACDLMIVDIFLASGSGLGVLAAARRRRPDVALAVLSNYATDEMRARCLAAGADRVFDKSRDIDQLVAYCLELEAGGGGRTH